MNILIIILIATATMSAIYSLGHYISIKNEFFLNNSFAEWVIGTISYFAITFAVFFPFIIIDVNKTYFVVIFFIKEFLVWSFIVYKRFEILKDTNIKDTLWIIVSGILVVILYNSVFEGADYEVTGGTGQTVSDNNFQSWVIYENNIIHFTKLSSWEVQDWAMPIIVASTLYAIIASIFTNIIRADGLVERVASLIVVFIILSSMSFGIPLHASLGIYLIFFAMLLGIRLIIYSRRRYGALFGILSFVIWSIAPELLSTIIVVALITIIMYTYRVRPKPSLFFIQLTMPLVMLISLEFYEYNPLISMTLLALSSFSYIFILTINNAFMERLNNFLLKYKIVLPTTILFLASFIMLIVVMTMEKGTSWSNLITVKAPFFEIANMPSWVSVIQQVVFISINVFLLGGSLLWLAKKKDFTKEMLFLGFVALTILIAFNPLLEKTMSLTAYNNQFVFLRILIVPPLLIVGTTRLISAIKNRIH